MNREDCAVGMRVTYDYGNNTTLDHGIVARTSEKYAYVVYEGDNWPKATFYHNLKGEET